MDGPLLEHSTAAPGHFVTPGEVITEDPAFMRGHGTYRSDAEGGALRATVAGLVERTNMLISVRPLRSRYLGDIGDVVIGRITVVGNKRWKAECNARQDAVLALSSIYLPGGIQRRKSEEDELQMRTFFAEGELIVAEVQTLFSDGAVGIHTRNLRYGKLVTGELLRVQPALIRRQRSHFLLLEPPLWTFLGPEAGAGACAEAEAVGLAPGQTLALEVILGMNGMIWVGKPRRAPVNQEDLDAMYSNTLAPVSREERRAIVACRNAIRALDQAFRMIDEASIMQQMEAPIMQQ